MAVPLSGDGMREEQGGSRETGQRDPPAPWAAFVGTSPRRFAPPITTVPAEGPSAESFDRSLPRHPPCRADLALVARDSGPAQLVAARPPSGNGFGVEGSDTVIAASRNGRRPCRPPPRPCR